MGPRTGPRPASSTPRHTGTPRGEGSAAVGAGGRRDGGTGEKCEYEAPWRRGLWWTDGGMKVPDVEGAATGSVSSSMLKLWSVGCLDLLILNI